MPRAGHPHQFTWCHNPYAEMLPKARTQGKGQVNVAEMPTLLHPPQPITGGQRKCAEMPQLARPHQFLWCLAQIAETPIARRTIGGGSQYWPTEMSLEGRSPQPITGGQIYHAEMPRWPRPHQFTGCHIGYAEMLLKVRTKGKGHLRDAKMPRSGRPSRSITGGQRKCAEMPQVIRPHRIWAIQVAQQCLADIAQITRGHHSFAEMPLHLRLATKKGERNGQKIRR